MYKQTLIDTIDHYQSELQPFFLEQSWFNFEEENSVINSLRAFYASANEQGFDQNINEEGHFTGTALVLSSDLQNIVLTLHWKLNKWLPLGGHADGLSQMAEVALKEAKEESGISDLVFPTWLQSSLGAPLPVDFDIHLIPEYKEKKQHYHYDICYLLIANHSKLVISHESKDLRWVPLEDVKNLNSEKTLIRQIYKIQLLKKLYFDGPVPQHCVI